MAIARQSAPTVNNPGAAVTPRTISTFTVNAGPNTVLLVKVGFAGNGAGAGGVTSITWDGVTMTLPANGNAKSTTWSGVQLAYLKAPNIGNKNLVVTMAATSGNFAVSLETLEGVDQASVVRALPTPVTATAGTTNSITVANVIGSDWLADVLDIDNTGHSAVVTGTGQVSDFAVETVATDTSPAGSTTQRPTTGTMAWSWTTAGPNSHVAAAFIAAPSGGVTPWVMSNKRTGPQALRNNYKSQIQIPYVPPPAAPSNPAGPGGNLPTLGVG